MVNLGLNLSSLLGIILAVAGAGLYFLRTWRPKLARDHDIFFAAIGLLCGGILLFQGWRLDPILAFGQFLLTGSAIFFAAEAITMRGLTTQQAKGRTPVVDEDRSVSRVYSYVEAELDELEPVEEYPPNRRIRGSQDYRSSRPDPYEDDYRRRPPTRRSSYDRPVEPKTKLRKRSSRSEDYPRASSQNWENSVDQENRPPRSRSRDNLGSLNGQDDNRYYRSSSRDGWETTDEERPNRSRSSRPTTTDSYSEERPPRTRRRRPPEASSPEQEASTPTDYVDYTPMDSADNDQDGSANI
ncbi:MAG: Ycf66 family protein [Microcoleaceae cyanobacterium MO_207.B10]|nr:Ycf66 family protein [Microcoleaceae cyanobacterium MO_207.B10]